MSEAIVLNAPTPADPQQLLILAVEKGLDPATLEKMMNLQERWQAGQARKAFVIAMSQFKAEVPPVLSKDAKVDFENRTGQRTHYKYANLGSIVAIVTPILSKHELSASWETSQNDKGEVTVTCHVTHSAGHRESVTLRGQPDNSGNKNPIQMIGSTVEYLRRYTFLCATGLATGDVDTDGLPEVKPVGGADNTTPPAHPKPAPTSTPPADLPAALVSLGDGETKQIEVRFDAVQPPPAGKKAKRVTLSGREYPTLHEYGDCQPGDKLLVTFRASLFNNKMHIWADDHQNLQAEELPMDTPPAPPPAALPPGVKEFWPETEFDQSTEVIVASVAGVIEPVLGKSGKHGPHKVSIKRDDGTQFVVDTFDSTLAAVAKSYQGTVLHEIAFVTSVSGKFTNRRLVGCR